MIWVAVCLLQLLSRMPWKKSQKVVFFTLTPLKWKKVIKSDKKWKRMTFWVWQPHWSKPIGSGFGDQFCDIIYQFYIISKIIYHIKYKWSILLNLFVWIDFDKAKANNQHKTGSDLDVQEHKHDNMSCRYLSKKYLGFGRFHHFAGGAMRCQAFISAHSCTWQSLSQPKSKFYVIFWKRILSKWPKESVFLDLKLPRFADLD